MPSFQQKKGLTAYDERQAAICVLCAVARRGNRKQPYIALETAGRRFRANRMGAEVR